MVECGLLFLGALASLCFILSLCIHHCNKHEKDLPCPDRCFQPEEVCVLCDTTRPLRQRCSHEMWMVVFAGMFVLCYWQLRVCE